MKKTLLILPFLIIKTTLFAQDKWVLDKAHAHLSFTATHLAISEVQGDFKDFDVTITTKKADFSDAVFSLKTSAASVNTGNEIRDHDLKSDHFFDVANYPIITFVSDGIKKTATNRYALTGNLTIGGTTKKVTANLIYKGTVMNPVYKKNDAVFQMLCTIRRSDFNLGKIYPTAMIGDEIEIRANGEFGLSR